MQTSMVFNQVHWPGIGGDVDDCWAVSGIQLVNVSAPWLRLVGVKTFRTAADNPDRPGVPDGGKLIDIERGILGCYPFMDGLIKRRTNMTWDDFKAMVRAGQPASVSIDSSKLDPSLRFRYTGLHQITVAFKHGQLLYANPLAPVYSRWLKVKFAALRRAILSYGDMRQGHDCVYAVFGPTDVLARAKLCATVDIPDTTPFDQEDIDAATAALQDRIDRALADLQEED